MFVLETKNKKVKKELDEYILSRTGIKDKLQNLKKNPRGESGAHPLQGRLSGKWACWLGSNIRMIYKINDAEKTILIEAIGSHKIY
ncbi:MAG: type II toxin-antitoxin system mRNA interferase toxin, RelE/StbE family [Nanoarchaeota archaeon]|nr:type II toxin-antitoxin system mRNA interferase toxin, RelE/StbE family [Nanoarchaeota archaeon]